MAVSIYCSPLLAVMEEARVDEHIHVDGVGMEQETGGGDLRNRVHYLERTVGSGCDAANGEQGWEDSLRG